jgi:hypothetical protein
MFGEKEEDKLCQRFRLIERSAIRAHQVFRDTGGKECQEPLTAKRSVVTSTAVSSAEYERGFTALNPIVTDTCAALMLTQYPV